MKAVMWHFWFPYFPSHLEIKTSKKLCLCGFRLLLNTVAVSSRFVFFSNFTKNICGPSAILMLRQSLFQRGKSLRSEGVFSCRLAVRYYTFIALKSKDPAATLYNVSQVDYWFCFPLYLFLYISLNSAPPHNCQIISALLLLTVSVCYWKVCLSNDRWRLKVYLKRTCQTFWGIVQLSESDRIVEVGREEKVNL